MCVCERERDSERATSLTPACPQHAAAAEGGDGEGAETGKIRAVTGPPGQLSGSGAHEKEKDRARGGESLYVRERGRERARGREREGERERERVCV